MSEQVFTINDTHAFYETAGKANGESFVLIHGIGVSRRYFRPLAQELARDNKVYLIDLPGFGKSPKPPHDMGIGEYAEFIASFLDANKIDNPVLIGHSMGCQVVTEMLGRSTVAAAVLIGPVVNAKERSGFKQAIRLLQDGFYESLSVNWIVFTDYIRCGLRWYLKNLPKMLNYKIEKNLRPTARPVLLIRGSKDVIAPENWLNDLAAIANGARAVTIPGSGHVAMYTQPSLVAAAIKKVIDEKNN